LRLALLPFGLVDVAVLEEIRRSLSEAFPDTEVFVLRDMLPLPDEAYNLKRGQYHSSKVLSLIQSYPMKLGVDRVLGITEADLYVPRLNFVFGEASPFGTAIISLFRLRPEFYGEPSKRELFFERASKEAIHEIGHTLGLGHCQDPRCVMFFSNSIFDTDRKMLRFCRHCEAKISKTT